jgi:hypothetical protein
MYNTMTTEPIQNFCTETESNNLNRNKITISGGVILKQNGLSIIYKPKCDNCGNAESTESKVTITKGVTEITTMKCTNCGYNQTIKMKYIAERR